MKTISLKNVKDGLSRDEMRAVKGGCFGHAGGCLGGRFQCPDSCIELRAGVGWVCSSCCVA